MRYVGCLERSHVLRHGAGENRETAGRALRMAIDARVVLGGAEAEVRRGVDDVGRDTGALGAREESVDERRGRAVRGGAEERAARRRCDRIRYFLVRGE